MRLLPPVPIAAPYTVADAVEWIAATRAELLTLSPALSQETLRGLSPVAALGIQRGLPESRGVLVNATTEHRRADGSYAARNNTLTSLHLAQLGDTLLSWPGQMDETAIRSALLDQMRHIHDDPWPAGGPAPYRPGPLHLVDATAFYSGAPLGGGSLAQRVASLLAEHRARHLQAATLSAHAAAAQDHRTPRRI